METEVFTHFLDLRVCDIIFRKVQIRKITLGDAIKYELIVEDPTFGSIPLSSNMWVEWKRGERWKRTQLLTVINFLLGESR
jgi:hypothetical protein